MEPLLSRVRERERRLDRRAARSVDLPEGVFYGGPAMSDLRKDPTRGQWVLVRPSGAPPPGVK